MKWPVISDVQIRETLPLYDYEVLTCVYFIFNHEFLQFTFRNFEICCQLDDEKSFIDFNLFSNLSF